MAALRNGGPPEWRISTQIQRRTCLNMRKCVRFPSHIQPNSVIFGRSKLIKFIAGAWTGWWPPTTRLTDLHTSWWLTIKLNCVAPERSTFGQTKFTIFAPLGVPSRFGSLDISRRTSHSVGLSVRLPTCCKVGAFKTATYIAAILSMSYAQICKARPKIVDWHRPNC